MKHHSPCIEALTKHFGAAVVSEGEAVVIDSDNPEATAVRVRHITDAPVGLGQL